MERIEKAKAMKCFGKLVEAVDLDPDPNAQLELEDEYNCRNCESYQYCIELSDTL